MLRFGVNRRRSTPFMEHKWSLVRDHQAAKDDATVTRRFIPPTALPRQENGTANRRRLANSSSNVFQTSGPGERSRLEYPQKATTAHYGGKKPTHCTPGN